MRLVRFSALALLMITSAGFVFNSHSAAAAQKSAKAVSTTVPPIPTCDPNDTNCIP